MPGFTFTWNKRSSERWIVLGKESKHPPTSLLTPKAEFLRILCSTTCQSFDISSVPNMALSPLRQHTIALLKQHIVNEHSPNPRCPLDHEKHDCTTLANARVGDLHILPSEIRHHVLSFLDIKSLLTFRRASKLAMNLVHSNTEYYKVVTKASMALRMAIAIGMHDKYTIAYLFGALCQRKCADCNTLAHHVCLLTCERLCLSQNGFFQGKLGPWRLVRQESNG